MDSAPNVPQGTPAAEDGEQLPLPLWKRMLFALILATLMYALLEFAAVVYLKKTKGYDGKHLVQYQFDPYKNILPTVNYRDTRGIEHNSVGFRRSGEVKIARDSNSIRVFLMGASTAYGLGGLWPHLQREFEVLKNSETIDAYLERELSREFPGRKVEVINAAITSTWTHHHLIYLNQTILKYHPDMVVFLDGFNDYYFYDRSHDQFSTFAYQEQANGILGDPTLGSLFQANAWWAYRASALAFVTMRTAKQIRQAVKASRAKATRRNVDVADAMAGLREVFPKNALKMVERNVLLTGAEHVSSVVVLQPMLLLERNRQTMPAIERKLFDFNFDGYATGYEDYIRQAVPWVRDTLQKVVKARGGMFLDATGIFEETREQVFTDYAHLTPKANEMLAKFIGNNILPVLKARDSLAAPALLTHKRP